MAKEQIPGGLFITLEGPEGSGKTSQIGPFTTYLKNTWDVITTREPGGTVIGDQMRDILLRMDNKRMKLMTEVLLFQAARAQHVEEIVKPALGEGKIVICDRYADCSLAYQGYGHGMDLVTLRFLTQIATGGLKPDLTLLLSINPEEGIKRKQRSEEWNRIDAQELAFHERVYWGYLELAKQEPDRFRVIDASKSREEVQVEMQQQFLEYMQLRAAGMLALSRTGWV